LFFWIFIKFFALIYFTFLLLPETLETLKTTYN